MTHYAFGSDLELGRQDAGAIQFSSGAVECSDGHDYIPENAASLHSDGCQ